MKSIVLSKKQMSQLTEIYSRLGDGIDEFTLTETNESGIGPTLNVAFTLFDFEKDIKETKVDITDVSKW